MGGISIILAPSTKSGLTYLLKYTWS